MTHRPPESTVWMHSSVTYRSVACTYSAVVVPKYRRLTWLLWQQPSQTSTANQASCLGLNTQLRFARKCQIPDTLLACKLLHLQSALVVNELYHFQTLSLCTYHTVLIVIQRAARFTWLVFCPLKLLDLNEALTWVIFGICFDCAGIWLP